MLQNKNAAGEFWCPAESATSPTAQREPEMTPADWAALSRFSSGDWVSDAHIARLQALGLVEKVFGQALLTRLGRSTIGIEK